MNAGDVARHDVRRELDPFEAAAAGPGKSAEQHGLSGSRYILQKNMTSAKITDDNQSDLLLFAYNSL